MAAGLSQMAAVVCDLVTAKEPALAAFSGGARGKTGRVILFSLLAESSLAELRSYEEFVNRPVAPL